MNVPPATPREIPQLADGTIVEGRYKVTRRVGRGTAGAVYLAEDLLLSGRRVALKLFCRILAEDQTSRARMAREILAGKAVKHNNLVGIYDLIMSDSLLGYSMEYVEGVNLEIFMQSKAPSDREAVNLLLQIAEAVGALHRKGLIHRDLKPANIIVSGDGIAKVTDLGLVRECAEKVLEAGAPSYLMVDGAPHKATRHGVILGTPLYVDPAYLKSGEVSPQTDIYALGLIAYQLFTGEEPYGLDPLAPVEDVIGVKAAFDPRPIAEVRPGISQSIAGLIEKCIRRDSSERFKTMEEVAAILRKKVMATTVRQRPSLSAIVRQATGLKSRRMKVPARPRKSLLYMLFGLMRQSLWFAPYALILLATWFFVMSLVGSKPPPAEQTPEGVAPSRFMAPSVGHSKLISTRDDQLQD